MNKNVIALVLWLLVFQFGFSQQELPQGEIYNKLAKSIVTVTVKHSGGINMCTGFVWQRPDMVVTSLHAMHDGAVVSVKYFNDSKYLFKAVPVQVYKDGDLVLLRIVKGDLELPFVEPMTQSDVNLTTLKQGEEIYTIGYPGGARYASDKVLEKGWIQKPPPETLESFLDKIYVDKLREHEFPRVDIEIVYVRGSLLPGYSGSPCVDKYGKLVGIGDGGLENGQKNVSWLIPAKFLFTLEKSKDTRLPQALATSLHFCSTIPYSESNGEQWADSAIYKPISSEDFEFYLVKNRSLQEMYESSGNDNNLIRILTQFKNEFNVTIDPRNLRFDVYEDVKKGVVVAVPEGQKLYFHSADNHFQVDTIEGRDVNILFNGLTGDFSKLSITGELDQTFRWLLDSMQTYWNVSNFEIDDNFTSIYNLYDNPNISDDDNRKVANVLMKSDPTVGKDGSLSTVYLYVTMVMAQEKKFISIASYKISNDKLNHAKETGVNCFDSQVVGSDCEYFQTFIKAFCSAHLTTFAF
jgi:hypothetical protein